MPHGQRDKYYLYAVVVGMRRKILKTSQQLRVRLAGVQAVGTAVIKKPDNLHAVLTASAKLLRQRQAERIEADKNSLARVRRIVPYTPHPLIQQQRCERHQGRADNGPGEHDAARIIFGNSYAEADHKQYA